MPAGLQQIFQTNWLNRRFEEQLASKAAFRLGAYRHPMPVRSGETTIFSRAGRIVPVVNDMATTTNTGLDNNFSTPVGGVGSANNAYPYEQFQVTIGEIGNSIDINVVQQQQVISDLFKQNWDNLAEQASLSLDLKAAQATFLAYESGRTWVTAAATSATQHVDNIKGFDTQFGTVTIGGVAFASGAPVATTALSVTIYPASGAAAFTATVSSTTADGTNTSTQIGQGMTNGVSGNLVFSASQTLAIGDVVVASDAPAYIRPNNKRSRYAMTTADTIGIQMVINAVALLRANNVAPMSDGTYACFIDPILMAQFYSDPQFQIMSQGAVASPLFKSGMMLQQFGVTFVQTTNAPAYGPITNVNSQSIYTRRAIVCGDRYLYEAPFAGLEAAYKGVADMGIADVRIQKDVAVITRPPLDRQGQILGQTWIWIGGFVCGTDATITPNVVPTATTARYKRAVVIEAASNQ